MPEPVSRSAGSAGGVVRIDQAAGLRRIFRAPGVRVLPVLGDDVSVSRLLDIARAIAATGDRVLVIEESEPGADDVPTLAQLLAGTAEFEEAAIDVCDGVRWMSSGGAFEALDREGLPTESLYAAFGALADPVDVVLLHATRPRSLARLVDREGECLLVMSSTDASLASAYRVLKLAASARRHVRVLVDGAPQEASALRSYKRIAQTAERFLGVVPRLVGWVPPESPRDRTTGGVPHRTIARLATELAGWHLAEYPSERRIDGPGNER